jgi:hypothetical protein
LTPGIALLECVILQKGAQVTGRGDNPSNKLAGRRPAARRVRFGRRPRQGGAPNIIEADLEFRARRGRAPRRELRNGPSGHRGLEGVAESDSDKLENPSDSDIFFIF